MPVFDETLLARLRQAQTIVVLTGAGVSAESGIPTFRDKLTGLWSRFDASQLATPEAFAADPALVWGWYEWRREKVLRCAPNPAHHAIAALPAFGPDVWVLTQNVDDLHERAGSTHVVHLHGSLHHPRCSTCKLPATYPDEIPQEPDEGRRIPPPRCSKCQSFIRPGVVWFGESLPVDAWALAQKLTAQCDVLLSVGTSSLVYPAAQLPLIARDTGATIVQINPSPTGIEEFLDYRLQAKAAQVLPALVQAAWPH